MAFTITARQTGTSVGTAAPFATSSATPTANSLLLLGDAAQSVTTLITQVHATPTGGGWTYSQIGTSPAQASWAGDAQYAIRGALWQAPIGPFPAAHTITVDAFSGTQNAIYAPIACDITGHSVVSPILQYAQNSVDTQPGGGAGIDNASGTITLGAAPTTGNLIVVYFCAAADNLGGISSPTMGAGKNFTSLAQQGAGTIQSGMWYRIADGTESTTITSADLGQNVGNYYAAAVEVTAHQNYTSAMWFTA